jgi:hypothetical protein
MIRQLCRAASRRILKNNGNNLLFINNNISILPTPLKTPKGASSKFLRIFCTVRDLDFVGKVAIDPESFTYEDKDTPIEYVVYGRRYVGIIQRPMGRRHWAIVNQQGKEEKINKYQLSFQWPKAPVPLSHEQVRAMENEARQLAAKFDEQVVEKIWKDLVQQGVKLTSGHKIAPIIFPNGK